MAYMGSGIVIPYGALFEKAGAFGLVADDFPRSEWPPKFRQAVDDMERCHASDCSSGRHCSDWTDEPLNNECIICYRDVGTDDGGKRCGMVFLVQRSDNGHPEEVDIGVGVMRPQGLETFEGRRLFLSGEGQPQPGSPDYRTYFRQAAALFAKSIMEKMPDYVEPGLAEIPDGEIGGDSRPGFED